MYANFRCVFLMTLMATLVSQMASIATAQTPALPQTTSPLPEQLVELNLNGSVPIPQLVQVLGQQMDVRFLYGSDLAKRRVNVFSPTKLPASALPILLGSLLKAENLAIVDSDVPGFKRIVDYKDMTKYAQPGDAAKVLRQDGPAAAVTQVIQVANVDPTTLAVQLRPFLSEGSNFITLADSRLIIVTDFAENLRTIVRLLEIIDRPIDQGVIEFYQTTRRPAKVLIDQVESLLLPKDPSAEPDFRLFNDASGGRVIVAASRARVIDIVELLRRLDTGTDFETKLYKLQNVAAGRIEALALQIAGSPSKTDDREQRQAAEPTIETTVDEDGNLLIVRASPEVHAQIRRLVEQLDVPVSADESPIRFYKLKNASANEVLLSLLSLQEATGTGTNQFGGGVAPANFNNFGIGGPGVAGVGLGGVMPVSGSLNAGFGGANSVAAGNNAFGNNATGNNRLGGNVQNLQSSAGTNLNRGVAGGNLGIAGSLGIGGAASLGGGGGGVASLPGGARISADVATNSLIVVAPANVQPLYERLIESLDQRRPQVLIQADIVAIDTSNNFSLGVEIIGGDREGAMRLFSFSSFGLTEIDTNVAGGDPGQVTAINPSLGFNGVLLDPDVADVVIQALSANTRSRVLASPKVLVNDNETGTLESVTSIPFQTIGLGDTASVATLGGDQSAGTTISVTPQINENDFLKLAFEAEFSTFGAGGSVALPPPRQIDRVGSVVTIPDGQTVVVGGLQRIDETDAFTGIPILERIPILRELSSQTSTTGGSMSFFLFIRPTILRDSQFRDLQYLSDVDRAKATLQGDEPESLPILIGSNCPPPPSGVVVDGRSPLVDCLPGEEVIEMSIEMPLEASAEMPGKIPGEIPAYGEPLSQPIVIEPDMTRPNLSAP